MGSVVKVANLSILDRQSRVDLFFIRRHPICQATNIDKSAFLNRSQKLLKADLLKTALQAVLRPLTRYIASGFRLNVQFFTNGGVTPVSSVSRSTEARLWELPQFFRKRSAS